MKQMVDIQVLADKLNLLSGKMVHVYIKHLLYGTQHVKCALRFLWDGERIGLIINQEDIYIKTCELHSINICGNRYIIKSAVMELHITA